MTNPTHISPTEWQSVTERIFHGVGAQIRETRKIQFHLRFILASILVAIMFLIYTVALMTA
jgi:hypothetical protein